MHFAQFCSRKYDNARLFQFEVQKQWIDSNFPKDLRFENAMLTGEDVLQPEYLQYVSEVTSSSFMDHEMSQT